MTLLKREYPSQSKRGGSSCQGHSSQYTREYETSALRTDLVHLEQGAFAHLLERDYLLRLLVPSEVNLAVTSLADLGHNMKLVQLDLCTSFAEQHSLASTV